MTDAPKEDAVARCWSCGDWKITDIAECKTCYSEGRSRKNEREIRNARAVGRNNA